MKPSDNFINAEIYDLFVSLSEMVEIEIVGGSDEADLMLAMQKQQALMTQKLAMYSQAMQQNNQSIKSSSRSLEQE
jgi:hypothetical protein